MLEQIVKDLATTVKENVQAGMKAVVDRFEPRLKALEEYRAEAMVAREEAVKKTEEIFLKLAGPAIPKEDPLSEFAKAFTDEMSRDGA